MMFWTEINLVFFLSAGDIHRRQGVHLRFQQQFCRTVIQLTDLYSQIIPNLVTCDVYFKKKSLLRVSVTCSSSKKYFVQK